MVSVAACALGSVHMPRKINCPKLSNVHGQILRKRASINWQLCCNISFYIFLLFGSMKQATFQFAAIYSLQHGARST